MTHTAEVLLHCAANTLRCITLDAQHRTTAGEHIQRCDRFGQQPRIPVDHRCNHCEQPDPFGLTRQVAQRRVGPSISFSGGPRCPICYT
jgi:hypothetical protein